MQIFKNFSGEHAPGPPRTFLDFLISFKLVLPKKKTLEKIVEIMPLLSKFLATPQPALVVGEENLVIGFAPPHFRNAFAITAF